MLEANFRNDPYRKILKQTTQEGLHFVSKLECLIPANLLRKNFVPGFFSGNL